MSERRIDTSIRPLGEADAAAYHALRLRALADHPTAFTSSFDEDSVKPLEWARARLALKLGAPHDFVLGAFDGDALVGIVGLTRGQRAKERHKADVFGMYVARPGHGIGRLLIDECIARAAKIPALSELRLTVTDGNTAAQALYEAVGFRVWGVEPRAVIVQGVAYAKCHMFLRIDG